MKDDSLHPWIEPELEARIVALVVGEASDFETEELERLIEEKPELGLFRQRMESLHGMLRANAKGDVISDDDDWKLSTEKRDAVLAAIQGVTDGKPEIEKNRSEKNRGWNWKGVMKVAAMVTISALVLGSAGLTFFSMANSEHRASSSYSAGDSGDIFDLASLDSTRVIAQNDELSRLDSDANGALSATTGGEVIENVKMEKLSVAPTSENSAGDDIISVSAASSFSASNVDVPASGVAVETGVSSKPSMSLGMSTSSSLDVDSSNFLKEGDIPDRGYAQIGHGGYSADMDVTEQFSPIQESGAFAFGAGGDLLVQQDGTSNLSVSASSGQMNHERQRMAYYDDAYDHTRSRMLKEVAEGWESPVPQAMKPDEGNAHSLANANPDATASKGKEISDPARNLRKTYNELDSPGQAAIAGVEDKVPLMGDLPQVGSLFGVRAESPLPAPVVSNGTIADSRTEKAAPSGEKVSGNGDWGEPPRAGDAAPELAAAGQVSTGYMTDYVFTGVRESSDKEFGEKQHGGTVRIDGGADGITSADNDVLHGGVSLAVNFGEEQKVTKTVRDESGRFHIGATATFGDEQEEVDTRRVMIGGTEGIVGEVGSRFGATAISAQVELPEVGQIPVQGITRTKDRVVRRELPAIAAAPFSASKPQSRVSRRPSLQEDGQTATGGFQIGRGLSSSSDNKDSLALIKNEAVQMEAAAAAAKVETSRLAKVSEELKMIRTDQESALIPSGRSAGRGITSGLRSGAVAIDGATVDAMIGAASFRKTLVDLTELSAQEKPFSTFSLHVSDVSFKLAQAALAKGEWPDAERIRIEEFVNAFDYGDPLPSHEEKVAANLEQAIHPFLQQRNLLRVSMRTAATGRNSTTPLRLTFLLDNSGSMERADRRETVQKAFALLASMLQPADQVTLISFARQPRLLADRVSGDQAAGLVETVKNLPSEGGTNLEAALALAFEKAKEQQLPGAQNRIILLTDGAANLGDAEPQRLADKVEQMRNGGIAFDAAGIGTEGLNDEILEALTRKGDGRYYLLDEADDVDAGFAKQIAGALRPAAGNVKVQIEFNPERVGKYKLLGFEKHRLKKEDFRNDKVDAAELAAAEAGVAVYQIEVKPDGKGDVGSAFVRFRDMATGEMTERRWTIPYQSHPARPVAAAPSMQVATVAAMFGAKLKGDVLGDVVDLDALLQIVSGLPESWREKPRVAELKNMLESARAISGN